MSIHSELSHLNELAQESILLYHLVRVFHHGPHYKAQIWAILEEQDKTALREYARKLKESEMPVAQPANNADHAQGSDDV